MSCPICLETFTDPVVLPCGHSLCRGTCAKKLVKKARITCPTCRAVHWAPEGVNSLPKNYALEKVIEEKDKSEPRCPDHLDERVNLFCTQCYVPVCVKCCLTRTAGRICQPQHRDHQVIPLDQMQGYVQGLLSVVVDYLRSRQQEDYRHLDRVRSTDEQSDISARQLVIRLKLYDHLLAECREVTGLSDEETTWTKLEEFRLILKRLDSLPDPNSTRSSAQSDLKAITLEPDLTSAASQCFKFQKDIPKAPQVELENCEVGERFVSVEWTYEEIDCVGYFTVYYETGIFTYGLCSDLTSVIVTDFDNRSGKVTLSDLHPDKRYKVSVTASNDLGESLPSKYLYCLTSATNPEKCLI